VGKDVCTTFVDSVWQKCNAASSSWIKVVPPSVIGVNIIDRLGEFEKNILKLIIVKACVSSK